MFSISKNVEYALMCLRVMAENREIWSSRDLASKFHIPLKLLEKILQKLSSAQLISSTKGPSGGYSLKCEPELMKLNDVIRAVYGQLHLTQCMEHSYECSRKGKCMVRPSFHSLQELISTFLQSTSLHDFIQMDTVNSPHNREEDHG